jgi:hypothetical protein
MNLSQQAGSQAQTEVTDNARPGPLSQGNASRGVVLVAEILLLLVILDPTGDPMLMLNPGVRAVGQVIRGAILPVLSLLIVFSLCAVSGRMWLNSTARTALILTLLVIAGGLVQGLAENEPWNVWRESLAMVPLACIPLFLRFDKIQAQRLATFISTVLVVVCTLKVLIGQYAHMQVYGSLSFKLLLRQSPLLLFPYTLLLASYLSGVRGLRNTLQLMLATVGMLVAQARALYVAAAVVTFLVLWKYATLRKAIGFTAVLTMAAVTMTLLSDNTMAAALGRWSGEAYQMNVDYRLEQADVLMGRLHEKPLLGFGFGYYTPGYMGYEDLAIPQILELDLLNFATKTGLLLFTLYLVSYGLYAMAYARLRFADRQTELLAIAYGMVMLGLIVYSLFQTFHASLMFWLFYSLAVSFLFGCNGGTSWPRRAGAGGGSGGPV